VGDDEQGGVMNDARRKLLSKALELLTEAHGMLTQAAEEEQDYFDNMPENMQSGDKGSRAEEIADSLQNAVSELDGIISAVEDAGS
jgi:hypothetical protein